MPIIAVSDIKSMPEMQGPKHPAAAVEEEDGDGEEDEEEDHLVASVQRP